MSGEVEKLSGRRASAVGGSRPGLVLGWNADRGGAGRGGVRRLPQLSGVDLWPQAAIRGAFVALRPAPD